MKQIIFTLLFSTLAFSNPNLAVMKFENAGGIEDVQLTTFQEKFQYEVYKTGKFSIVERTEIDKVLVNKIEIT